MSPTLKTASEPQQRPELVPRFFELDQLVAAPGNPLYTPTMLEDLLESIRAHGQLVPGFVFPRPDGRFAVIEGNKRTSVLRLLGNKPFWAIDLGHEVPEEECIRLTFTYNYNRRVMSNAEVADRALRYISIVGCTQAEAAKQLGVRGPKLSQAFGENRIPSSLKAKTDLLGPSIRVLISGVPAAQMEEVTAFAETPVAGGQRKPTRDEVAAYCREIKKSGNSNDRRPKPVTLRIGNRVITFAMSSDDTATSVARDMKILCEKLSTLTKVPPDGWKFHF